MSPTEQLAIQIWLGNLLRLQRLKDYDKVESELVAALSTIEEDHAETSPPAV